MQRVANAANRARGLDELRNELASLQGLVGDWRSAVEELYELILRRVQGSSMSPTLCDGDWLLFTRFDGTVERGQVVVFASPSNPERDFVQRIVGEPGETVEVRSGSVYIDGEPLDEPYVANKPTYTFGPKDVPSKHFFVLGDNRNNSYDSHAWGFLPEDHIRGELPADVSGCETSGLVRP